MAFESAKWIWIDKKSSPDTYGEFYFTLKKGSDTWMNLSCDGDYTLFVNGKYVSSGQYGDYEHYKSYDIISLDNHLTKEKNHVAVLVWHFGKSSQRYIAYDAGVIFEVERDGEIILSSDAEILSRKSRAYKSGLCKEVSYQLGFSYLYNAENEDNWLLGKGEGFDGSVEVNKNTTFIPCPIKKSMLVNTVLPTEISDKKSTNFLFDLGREVVGYLTFETEAREATEVNISYGECLKNGHVKRKIGTRDFSIDYVSREGKNEYTNYMLRIAGRYLEVNSSAPIKVSKIGIIPCVRGLERQCPQCLDDVEKQIYNASTNTLELCMLEHYVDTPWREQCLYAFDSRNQMLAGYYAFKGGNHDYARANLLLMSKDNRADNLLSICFPCGIDLTIPSFSLYYVISLYEYLAHTGDTSLILEVNQKVKSVLDVFASNIENSLQMNFEGKEYWNFFDWSEGLDGALFSSEKKKTDVVLSLLTVIALKAYREICKDAELTFPYENVISKLSCAIKEKLYDKSKGLVLLDGKALELPNALLVLSGISSKDEEEKICQAILSSSLGECSLSMKCFVYDALLKSGGASASEYILSEIRKNYEKMVETGTVWETAKGESDFDDAGSLCHGWSALPIYYYHKLKENF